MGGAPISKPLSPLPHRQDLRVILKRAPNDAMVREVLGHVRSRLRSLGVSLGPEPEPAGIRHFAGDVSDSEEESEEDEDEESGDGTLTTTASPEAAEEGPGDDITTETEGGPGEADGEDKPEAKPIESVSSVETGSPVPATPEGCCPDPEETLGEGREGGAGGGHEPEPITIEGSGDDASAANAPPVNPEGDGAPQAQGGDGESGEGTAAPVAIPAPDGPRSNPEEAIEGGPAPRGAALCDGGQAAMVSPRMKPYQCR
jgi:hypothetical protein